MKLYLVARSGSDAMRQERRVSYQQELAIRTGKEEVEEFFLKDENTVLFLPKGKREKLVYIKKKGSKTLVSLTSLKLS